MGSALHWRSMIRPKLPFLDGQYIAFPFRIQRLVLAFDCTSLYHYLVRDLDNLDAQTTA